MKKLILTAALVAASVTFADKVYLKSGSYLTGTAGTMQDKKLNFASDDLGDLKIDIDKIAKLESDRKHVVQYNDNTREEMALTVKDGVYTVDEKPLDMSNVKATDPNVETWHGNVALSGMAARGNTIENSYSVLANVNRRWEIDRLNANFGYYYSETGVSGADAQKTTDRYDLEAQHDHFWTGMLYNYENVRWERDKIQELLNRYRVGIGLGLQWFENEQIGFGKLSFNQEAGVNWVKEEYDNNPDEKGDGFAALRYAHHLKFNPDFSDKVEFFHNLECMPEVDDWEKFLANADLGLTVDIGYGFNFLGKIEWDFNSAPANNRKKTDVRYIAGLGYKW